MLPPNALPVSRRASAPGGRAVARLGAVMPSSGAGPRPPGTSGGTRPVPSGTGRPLAVTGAIAACAAAGIGIAVLTLLVLVGWIAAPHAGPGLTGVLRTAALLWLI